MNAYVIAFYELSNEWHLLIVSIFVLRFQNPEIKENFFKASDHRLKVIWIESKSVHVVESKLRVYEEFKDLIDLNKILIHHASENHEDLLEHKALVALNNMCKLLSSFVQREVPMWSMVTIKDTFKKWSTQVQIRQLAYELHLPRETTMAATTSFVQDILRKLAVRFQADIYEDFAKYTNRILMQRLQTKLKEPILSILTDAVKPLSSFWERPLTRDSRIYLADELSKTLRENEGRDTFPKIENHIKEVFESTERDAHAILQEWTALRWKGM